MQFRLGKQTLSNCLRPKSARGATWRAHRIQRTCGTFRAGLRRVSAGGARRSSEASHLAGSRSRIHRRRNSAAPGSHCWKFAANWISGYAHLFSVAADLPRAKDLLAASAQAHTRSIPLVLICDSSDAEARAVADRVAVNLRELGIMVQVSGKSADGRRRLWPLISCWLVNRIAAPNAAMVLSEFLHSLGESPRGWKRLSKFTLRSARRLTPFA